MEKNPRILITLIEDLEEVISKLLAIEHEDRWINCTLPKDQSRSYTKLKSVLESLVMKTVEGKGYDEDIASICNQHKPYLEEYLRFQNLISADDYLKEAKNLSQATLKFDFLLTCLLSFQGFLEDILHSVCQISSCQSKTPSRILVKDLLKVKNQYLSIWDLMPLTENKYRRVSDLGLNLESKEIQSKIGDLQEFLQLSLKEMFTVKLEIEHYLKFNLLEMQFTKPVSEAQNGDVHVEEDSLNVQETDYYCLEKLCSSSKDLISNKTNVRSSSEWDQSIKIASSSQTLLPDNSHLAETQKSKNPHSFAHPTETWSNNSNNTFPEISHGDFFDQKFLFPQNFLFIDPPHVLIQNKRNVYAKNSLPKIYSVDSVDNQRRKETSKEWDSANSNNSQDESTGKSLSKGESVFCEQVKPIETEDLFGEDNGENDLYSVCLKDKISSLFDILRTSQTDFDEDIFEDTPLKIERSDFSYSKPFHKSVKVKPDANEKSANRKSFTQKLIKNKSKYNLINVINNNTASLKSKTKEHSGINESKVDHRIPLRHRQFNNNHNIKPVQKIEEVIYDKRSLIELYHSKESNRGSNNGSFNGEHSTFSLWPVTAEYIHVSKNKRINKCQSVSSDNSIPLSKSFEKSFYSLHLNKTYEQKKVYDGDLLVLENQESCVDQTSSSYSFLNQSFVVSKREENCKPSERENKGQSILNNRLDKYKEVVGKENKTNDFIKKGNQKGSVKDVKKTLAVHYTDCQHPFQVGNKQFGKENFDFLKINGFDENNNWNSFISIFTSKVGPTARIGHHRMFRKVINTITTDSLTCNNVFGNVHTLTSNGGPFRLFDINGYPLTDSAGNVLMDPYGKSVVTLDSTGFPKDNVKVFDAAGNSPNDINFDPTQKPKTNSIIIKLTDNFKRPLRLFDKYGRPLTDTCGKLLVNIHGRPLLRFDNFGRPNTDYRGGPLYTDNGSRWSYKTSDSLSSDQASSESIESKKLCSGLEIESAKASQEGLNLKNKNFGKINKNDETNLKPLNGHKTVVPVLNHKKSDIWIKVESLLKTFPKTTKIDSKTSQTSVIINNVTIAQNPLEKEFLKSIIYHNNIIQQDINHFNKIHYQPLTSQKKYFGIESVHDCMFNKRICMKETIQPTVYNLDPTKPIPFHNSIFVKKVCSKCMNLDNSKHFTTNTYLDEKKYDLGKPCIAEGDLLKTPVASTLTSYPMNYDTNNESYLTFKNHGYLDNLCNRILKHKNIPSENIMYSSNPQKNYKRKNYWTESSGSEFASSNSKDTTGYTTQTESPIDFSDTTKKFSQDIKPFDDAVNNRTQQSCPKYYFNKEQDSKPQGRFSFDCLQKMCNNKSYYLGKGIMSNIEEERKEKNNSHSESSKAALSINVLNQDNKHYEIKVTEMMSKIIKPKLNFSLFPPHKNYETKTHPFMNKKDHFQRNISFVSKFGTKNFSGNENHDKRINDSLFRFSSDDKMATSRAVTEDCFTLKKECKLDLKGHKKSQNTETEYFNNQEPTYQNQTMQFVKSFKEKEPKIAEPLNKKDQECKKYNNVNRKNTNPVKKRLNSNRECNLASFFGSPVKYVLNKLDGKRSFKPQNTNSPNKRKVLCDSKENLKRLLAERTSKDKSVLAKDINIRTIYDISKSSKKSMLSSNDKAEIRSNKEKLYVPKEETLLAFQSKSCTGLIHPHEGVSMSYSGNNSLKTAKEKNGYQNVTSNIKKLRKSVSAISYYSLEGSKEIPVRRSRKYQQSKEISNNEQSSFKSSPARHKHNNTDQRAEKGSKSRKHSSAGHHKSPFLTSKNKAKEISLFKKVEPEGKYMLKIKR